MLVSARERGKASVIVVGVSSEKFCITDITNIANIANITKITNREVISILFRFTWKFKGTCSQLCACSVITLLANIFHKALKTHHVLSLLSIYWNGEKEGIISKKCQNMGNEACCYFVIQQVDLCRIHFLQKEEPGHIIALCKNLRRSFSQSNSILCISFRHSRNHRLRKPGEISGFLSSWLKGKPFLRYKYHQWTF